MPVASCSVRKTAYFVRGSNVACLVLRAKVRLLRARLECRLPRARCERPLTACAALLLVRARNSDCFVRGAKDRLLRARLFCSCAGRNAGCFVRGAESMSKGKRCRQAGGGTEVFGHPFDHAGRRTRGPLRSSRSSRQQLVSFPALGRGGIMRPLSPSGCVSAIMTTK